MSATRLDRAIKAAGIAITGVSPDVTAPGGYRVYPENLQAVAQPIIDAFNPNDPAHLTAEQDAEIDNLKALQALARATFELKTNAWTLAQFRDRIKAIYRSL
jgi:hypothetical protein